MINLIGSRNRRLVQRTTREVLLIRCHTVETEARLGLDEKGKRYSRKGCGTKMDSS